MFDLATGEAKGPPASIGVARYEVQVEGEEIRLASGFGQAARLVARVTVVIVETWPTGGASCSFYESTESLMSAEGDPRCHPSTFLSPSSDG